MTLDQLVALSRSRPQRNIFGDLGPRCPTCSGLGVHFAPRVLDYQAVLREPIRCQTCDGAGLNVDAIERASIDVLWREIHAIESARGLSLTSRYRYPGIRMSRQYFMEQIAWAVTDGTAVSNTVTETILFPNVTIPANYMQDGRTLLLHAMGKYGTASASPGVNFIWSVRWGGVAGTLICKSGGLVTPTTTALSNGLWDLWVELQTRTNGSTGTVMGNGTVFLHDTTAQTMRSATNVGAFGPLTNGGQATPATATLDLTADTALSLTITESATGASNTMTGLNYTIRSNN